MPSMSGSTYLRYYAKWHICDMNRPLIVRGGITHITGQGRKTWGTGYCLKKMCM